MRVPFVPTYIVGPLAAFLPSTWRRALPRADRVHWVRAGTVSGLLQITAAVAGAAYWYMATMTPLMSKGAELALTGRVGEEVTEHQVGGVALAIFATHPLTLLFVYAFWEGAVRLCGAAFFEDVLGTLPLFLLERTIYLVTHREEIRSDEELRGHMASMVGGVRAKLLAARLENVPDELKYSNEVADEILEIFSSRPKQDWDPPKVVRVDESYYRLEASSVEKGPRPFRYQLRRLEAGVPGRNVLLYKTGKPIEKR